MTATEYDIQVSAVRTVVAQVGAAADGVRSRGLEARTAGESIASSCGTAQRAADAFLRFWNSRSETGVRSGDYGWGCADAVGLACQAISDGDTQMAHQAHAAEGEAASALRFGVREP